MEDPRIGVEDPRASAKALQAAAARADFVERLLEASDDCVTVLGLDASLVSMSAQGCAALGIDDFASIAGADWLSLWSPGAQGASFAAVEAARAGGRARFTGSTERGGTVSYWDVTVTPILGATGRPERLLAVARDITEMVDAQRELARSEERYRLLTESIPGTAWTATPDGRLDHITEGAAYAPRRPIEDRLGDAWLDGVHPEDRERVRAEWAHAVKTTEPYDTQFRVRMADGTFRWKLVRAQPQRDDTGAVVRWVGVNVDIDEQRRASDAREMFVALAENSTDIVKMAGRDGNVLYANPTARRMLSLDEATPVHFLECFAPQDRDFIEAVVIPATENEGSWAGEFRMRNIRTGAIFPVHYNVFTLYDGKGEALGLATISRDLRERQRIDIGMRALADTGAAMHGSLDYEQTLRNVAEALTKTFASYCVIDVVLPDGTDKRVAVAHANAARRVFLEQRASRTQLDPQHPIYRALHYGESTCVTAADEKYLETKAPSLGASLKFLGLRSFLTVPLRSPDGSVLGALSCCRDGDDPRAPYIPEDLDFAEELGRRAGIAVEHARAYERERAIAMRFQEASLPGVLSTVEGLSLSAEYRPGNSEATIGGDWYDAFSLDDGRLVFTIGDVLGKGLDAAVTMARIRQAMRSAASLLPDPKAMLRAAESAVREVSGASYATAMAGVYDANQGTFTFACSGHPGPTVHHPDGSIKDCTAKGVLLGLQMTAQNEIVTIAVPRGSTLVFYTDGLTEATRDMNEGYRRLHAAIADGAVRNAPNPAKALVDHVLADRPSMDDVAVLVAEINR